MSQRKALARFSQANVAHGLNATPPTTRNEINQRKYLRHLKELRFSYQHCLA